MKRAITKLLKTNKLSQRNLSHYEIRFSTEISGEELTMTIKFSKLLWNILPDAFFCAIIYVNNIVKNNVNIEISNDDHLVNKFFNILEQFSIVNMMQPDNYNYCKFNLFYIDKQQNKSEIYIPLISDIAGFYDIANQACAEFNI